MPVNDSFLRRLCDVVTRMEVKRRRAALRTFRSSAKRSFFNTIRQQRSFAAPGDRRTCALPPDRSAADYPHF